MSKKEIAIMLGLSEVLGSLRGREIEPHAVTTQLGLHDMDWIFRPKVVSTGALNLLEDLVGGEGACRVSQDFGDCLMNWPGLGHSLLSSLAVTA
jgi:hypothetical protein